MKYIVLVLILGFLMACHSQETKQTETEAVEESASLEVTSVLKNSKVKIGPILSKTVERTIPCTGELYVPPTALIAVHSKSEGYIESMKYVVGDYVKKGTLLYTISNPKLIEKQRILLETKIELEAANKAFQRKETLQQKEAISQKDFDQAYAQKQLLEATYKGLKSELQAIGIDLSALEQSNTFQEKIRVYASQSGYVKEVLVNAGQMIYPENKLMTLANREAMQLELKVLTKDIAFLKKGQTVTFTLDNYNQNLEASIAHLSPAVEENGVLLVYCTLQNPPALPLNAGMFVHATIGLGQQEVQGLPLEAVLQEGGDYFAYFVHGKMLEKTQLENVQLIEDFVIFTNLPKQNILTQGAYYVES